VASSAPLPSARMRRVGACDRIEKAFQDVVAPDPRTGGLDRELRTALDVRERLAALEARRAP